MTFFQVDSDSTALEVVAAMKEDGHNVPWVSHYARDDRGRVCGAWTVLVLPVMLFWSRTDNPALRTLRMWRHYQAQAQKMGHRRRIVMIDKGSPLWFFAEKLGMVYAGETSIMWDQSDVQQSVQDPVSSCPATSAPSAG